MRLWLLLFSSIAAFDHVYASRHQDLHRNMPSLPLGLWRSLRSDDQMQAQSSSLSRKRKAHYLQTPIDHFSGQANDTFGLRYWFDDTYYRPGGPVFCLEGGETSGTDRLPFLDTGILKILSEATNGLAIVLEHRYYGKSFPVEDLSTDNLRFLTTHQAVADNAYFTRHLEIPGLNLTDAKWIHYGGSYAGAKVALLRKLYPETVFGAIASSAVTEAVTDYWKYFEAIRLHADQDCVSAIIDSVSLVDAIINLENEEETGKLKSLFGVANLTHIQDVVSLLTYPLGAWQARNWDPQVGSTGQGAQVLLPASKPLVSVQSSYLSNYADYIRKNVIPLCKPEYGLTQDDCFGTFDREAYEKHSLDETWRSWTWQYCTEWGYLQSAPPALVPSLLSRQIDLNYTSLICRLAFPDGKYIQVPKTPNVTIVNQYGGYDLAEDRIAFIDGSFDPWIYATPHSPDVKQRESTLVRPFELIIGGVHHWDENGLPDPTEGDGEVGGRLRKEPPEIRKIHQREIEFVKSWLGL